MPAMTDAQRVSVRDPHLVRGAQTEACALKHWPTTRSCAPSSPSADSGSQLNPPGCARQPSRLRRAYTSLQKQRWTCHSTCETLFQFSTASALP